MTVLYKAGRNVVSNETLLLVPRDFPPQEHIILFLQGRDFKARWLFGFLLSAALFFRSSPGTDVSHSWQWPSCFQFSVARNVSMGKPELCWCCCAIYQGSIARSLLQAGMVAHSRTSQRSIPIHDYFTLNYTVSHRTIISMTFFLLFSFFFSCFILKIPSIQKKKK